MLPKSGTSSVVLGSGGYRHLRSLYHDLGDMTNNVVGVVFSYVVLSSCSLVCVHCRPYFYCADIYWKTVVVDTEPANDRLLTKIGREVSCRQQYLCSSTMPLSDVPGTRCFVTGVAIFRSVQRVTNYVVIIETVEGKRTLTSADSVTTVREE